jgi:hypothetical protein
MLSGARSWLRPSGSVRMSSCSDNTMPRLDGIQAAGELLHSQRSAHLVFLTVTKTPTSPRAVLDACGLGYVLKAQGILPGRCLRSRYRRGWVLRAFRLWTPFLPTATASATWLVTSGNRAATCIARIILNNLPRAATSHATRKALKCHSIPLSRMRKSAFKKRARIFALTNIVPATWWAHAAKARSIQGTNHLGFRCAMTVQNNRLSVSNDKQAK